MVLDAKGPGHACAVTATAHVAIQLSQGATNSDRRICPTEFDPDQVLLQPICKITQTG